MPLNIIQSTVAADSTDTLTNKTIDPSTNTFKGMQLIATATAVDFKTVATTTLLDCSADLTDGRKFVAVYAVVRAVGYDTPDNLGSVSIGTNAASYDDLNFSVGYSNLAATGDVQITNLHNSASTSVGFTTTSSDIVVNVSVGDGGTTLTCDIELWGLYV